MAWRQVSASDGNKQANLYPNRLGKFPRKNWSCHGLPTQPIILIGRFPRGRPEEGNKGPGDPTFNLQFSSALPSAGTDGVSAGLERETEEEASFPLALLNAAEILISRAGITSAAIRLILCPQSAKDIPVRLGGRSCFPFRSASNPHPATTPPRPSKMRLLSKEVLLPMSPLLMRTPTARRLETRLPHLGSIRQRSVIDSLSSCSFTHFPASSSCRHGPRAEGWDCVKRGVVSGRNRDSLLVYAGSKFSRIPRFPSLSLFPFFFRVSVRQRGSCDYNYDYF